MSRMVKTLALALALAAIAAAPVGATTGPAMLGSASPIGTASNIASIAQSTGPNLGSFAMIAAAGALNFRCSTIALQVSGVTTDAATVTPGWTDCTVILSGTVVGPAQFTVPCDWRLSFANGTFSNTSGATSGGTLTMDCAMQFSFTGQVGACVMDFPAQTREGIALQNIDAAGTNSTAATPWGTKIVANVTGLTYDATTNNPTTYGGCPILGHGTAAIATSLYLKNVWGRL